MILADTSVWVQHFRVGVPSFASALRNEFISIHPVVIGELSCGNIADRKRTLATLRCLPETKVGTAKECLQFLEMRALYGRGIGWNDIQLLVAALLSGERLWTLDMRLAKAAAELGAAYEPL